MFNKILPSWSEWVEKDKELGTEDRDKIFMLNRKYEKRDKSYGNIDTQRNAAAHHFRECEDK